MNARLAKAWCVAGLLLAVCLPAPQGLAIGPASVLVVYNGGSPDGVQIANYYAQARPGVHLLGLAGVSQDEEISADHYLSVIRPQILDFLNAPGAPQIDVIVTTKGLPLRISNSLENPGTYPGWRGDLYGINISDDWWKPWSSLESELARIDLIATPEQMGDQAYFLGPPIFPFSTDHHACNPYYGCSVAFDRAANEGMRLAARLDGFSVQDVTGAIDRAKKVFVVAGEHYVIVDDDPTAVATDVDRMTALTNNVLIPRGQAFIHDETDSAVLTAPGPVIGYVSHGVNDGAGGLAGGYITDQLQFNLARGAVFHTWESYNAVSFQPGGATAGQGLLGQWLAVGGTAGVGHVAEPTASITTVTNEDLLFDRLLGGFSFAEAAWAATRQLSYVNTVVGDPLMVFRPAIKGDANLDGRVLDGDLGMLLGHWDQPGSWSSGDFTGDGNVDCRDLNLLLSNWGVVDGGPVSVPEPGAAALLTLGALGGLRRKRFPGKTRFRRA